MTDCATYRAPFGSQIQEGGATGGVDCTAWATRAGLATATCGRIVVSGRRLRLLSNEPVPDPQSPGLNLYQMQDVLREDFGVYMDVRAGSRAISWSEYERKRVAGYSLVVQLSYAPIADSPFDAGRGFRGGHAMFEHVNAGTMDSLADGRAPGVFDYTGAFYPRDLIRRATDRLVIDPRTGATVPSGMVWAGVLRDVVPGYFARIPEGRVLVYRVRDGVIVDRDAQRTDGFSAIASPPRRYPDRAGLPGSSYELSRLLTGSRAGLYVGSHYVREV
jgi:hypothetical protein